MKKMCNGKTEVFSRVTGFYRPVQQFNKGKRQEFSDRVEFDVKKSMENQLKRERCAA